LSGTSCPAIFRRLFHLSCTVEGLPFSKRCVSWTGSSAGIALRGITGNHWDSIDYVNDINTSNKRGLRAHARGQQSRGRRAQLQQHYIRYHQDTPAFFIESGQSFPQGSHGKRMSIPSVGLVNEVRDCNRQDLRKRPPAAKPPLWY